MSIKTLLRWLGIFMIIDGALSLIFGKSYLRPWRHLGGPIATFVSVFLRWPDWLIRISGASEVVIGIQALGAAPFRIQEIYQVAAPVYDPLRALGVATLARGAEDAVDRAVAKYLPPGGNVLDLGCGTGANVARLQRLGIPFTRYIGVDLSPDMLDVARQKFGRLSNVTFLQRDLLRDPLPEGEFDLVISTWVLNHLKEEAREVVDKARERLKPMGHMVLLMASETESWLGPVIDALRRPFQAKPLSSDIYLSLPGRVELQRLAGGIATIVVLTK